MLRDVERSGIVSALADAEGNITRAAGILGCSRRTLTNRMREFGLPHGQSGRRRRILPYGQKKRGRWAAAAAAVAGLVLGGAVLSRSV